jgi:hypothetical protein
MKPTFSGHESFHCRPFWLKKGFDFVKSGNSFSDKAGIELGVGRNMVGSIRFWLKAFDVVDDQNEIRPLADKLFSDEGWDPFLEDEATLWLLHFLLNEKRHSTIYNLIFSELRKVKPEFSKLHLVNTVQELDSKQSDNIVEKDFSVFTRTYFSKESKDKEESFSGLFTELELLSEVGVDNINNKLYHINNKKQDSIPWQIVLYCILENREYSNSIGLTSLLTDKTGVGNVFAFTQEGLENKLVEIAENVTGITYKSDAGVQELQFKNEKPMGMEILKSYYEN